MLAPSWRDAAVARSDREAAAQATQLDRSREAIRALADADGLAELASEVRHLSLCSNPERWPCQVYQHIDPDAYRNGLPLQQMDFLVAGGDFQLLASVSRDPAGTVNHPLRGQLLTAAV